MCISAYVAVDFVWTVVLQERQLNFESFPKAVARRLMVNQLNKKNFVSKLQRITQHERNSPTLEKRAESHVVIYVRCRITPMLQIPVGN